MKNKYSALLLIGLLCLHSLYSCAQENKPAREVGIIIVNSADYGPPDCVTLNGTDIRDNPFVPGRYHLEIRHPGYFPLEEEIEIPEGEGLFYLERKLRCKPLIVQVRLEYDVEPPPGYQYSIYIGDSDESSSIAHRIQDGGKIEPGYYKLTIEQDGYESIHRILHALPAEAPIVIEDKLITKPVQILLNLSYSVPPAKDSPPPHAILMDKQTNIAYWMLHGQKIKPGSYIVDVVCPGYDFGGRKEITIVPTEQPFIVCGELVAKQTSSSGNEPVPIAWETLNGQEIIKIYKVVHARTEKEITVQDRFLPGQKIECRVLFKFHKTAHISVTVSPGDGYFKVEAPAIPLKKVSFTIRQKEITIDEITYPYFFYWEDELVEPHHVEITQSSEHYFWVTLYGYCEKEDIIPALQVCAGYLFTRTGRGSMSPPGSLVAISIPRLIEHLERVSSQSETKHLKSLEILEEFRKSQYRLLKEMPGEEMQSLIQYVQGWQFTDDSHKRRQKKVLEKLMQ